MPRIGGSRHEHAGAAHTFYHHISRFPHRQCAIMAGKAVTAGGSLGQEYASGPHRFSNSAPFRDFFDDIGPGGAKTASPEESGKTDRPRSDDRHDIARHDPRGHDPMKGDSERFGQRGIIEGHCRG